VVLSGMRLEVRIHFALLGMAAWYMLLVNICCEEVWNRTCSDGALLEEKEHRRVAACDGVNGAQHSHLS